MRGQKRQQKKRVAAVRLSLNRNRKIVAAVRLSLNETFAKTYMVAELTLRQCDAAAQTPPLSSEQSCWTWHRIIKEVKDETTMRRHDDGLLIAIDQAAAA